jgi:ABC-2 type transport system ATP-binding protein
MDEPFSGLDPVNATLLQDTLVDLRKDGKAILFSTHRMDQVEKLCDSIALISRGKLLLSGSMREVKSQYPRNHVQMVFEGSDAFLTHPGIEDVKNYSGRADITLRNEDAAQDVLAAALAAGARISRFEVIEPTLEEIFIENVRASFGDAESGGIVDA